MLLSTLPALVLPAAGVPVPAVPPYVDEPTLTWPEGVLIVAFTAAVLVFTVPLARAWWPWSKPRETRAWESRAWIAALVAIPVLAFVGWRVDAATENHYDSLEQERDAQVAAIADDALVEVEAAYGVELTEGDESRFRYLIDTDSPFGREREAQFVDASGVSMTCMMSISPPEDGREVTLECPPTTPDDT